MVSGVRRARRRAGLRYREDLPGLLAVGKLLPELVTDPRRRGAHPRRPPCRPTGATGPSAPTPGPAAPTRGCPEEIPGWGIRLAGSTGPGCGRSEIGRASCRERG